MATATRPPLVTVLRGDSGRRPSADTEAAGTVESPLVLQNVACRDVALCDEQTSGRPVRVMDLQRLGAGGQVGEGGDSCEDHCVGRRDRAKQRDSTGSEAQRPLLDAAGGGVAQV
jgi:hypothetical protein